jgi:hypothetical protein
MSTSERLRRFASLPSAERLIVWVALITLPMTWLAVRWLPIRHVHLPALAATRDRRLPASRIAALVASTAAALPLPCACLEQSIVTAALLRRRGYAATLVIGGDKVDARFDAHAWVEHEGVVLTDPVTAARYTPLWRVSS